MDAFTIRTMRPDEIQLAVDWAAAEGWNPGIADAPVLLLSIPKAS